MFMAENCSGIRKRSLSNYVKTDRDIKADSSISAFFAVDKKNERGKRMRIKKIITVFLPAVMLVGSLCSEKAYAANDDRK